jgi:hypothetical protein
MVSVTELQTRVASDFERLNLDSWPDPHLGVASPRDEEYSRVTDPGRYRIVHARAGVWAEVLKDALGARAEAVTDDGRVDAFDRGVRLIPREPGALPLLFLERDVPALMGAAPLSVLQIGVVRPDVVVEMQPECGCDACDSGSDNLLEAIDRTISAGGGWPVRRVAGPNVACSVASGWR